MPGIDGLRAIAVAAVFVYHADRPALPGGFLGVDVFFVISGYLITSLLLSELASTGRVSLARFWARRARRLLPALFALLGVCLIAGLVVEHGSPDLRGDALASIFYVANWRFIVDHESYFAQFGRPPLLRHLWSLAVEEQFYLLWPPLFVLAARLRRRVLPVVVGAAALGSTALMWVLYTPGTDTSRVYYGTDTHAAPLLVGVLLAFLWKPDALPKLRRPFARPAFDGLSLAALGAVAFTFAAVHDTDSTVYRGGFLLVAVASAVLLATIVHPLSVLGRVLDLPLLRGLGERSYAIYLWHWPVLAFTRPGVDVHAQRWLVIALQVALTLVLADLSYRFVERPIRGGALRRLRIRAPRLATQPRTPFAVAVVAVAALLGLTAFTPSRGAALPPGFTSAALAQSRHAAAQPIVLPRLMPHLPHKQPHAVGRTLPHTGPILAVGDSVMLGASTELRSAVGSSLHVDAVVSRQVDATIGRLLAYRAEGSLPRRVVVHVGDNGPVYWRDWRQLHRALAGVPLVVIVNVRVDRSWQNEVNRELRQYVSGWRQATIADWYDASAHSGTLVDGIHTSSQGARIFAALIRRALRSPRRGGVTH
jgi:peptidoglycan/LPS O-acetylase OafA/YrhL